MKQLAIFFLLIFIFGCNGSGQNKALKKSSQLPILRVGITKNLNGEWFPQKAKKKLEDTLFHKIEFVYFDGVEKLLASEDSLDLAFGIDKSFLRQAIVSRKFRKYKPKNARNIKKDIELNKTFYFTPIFCDYACILADTTQIKNIPLTLGKFQEDIYKNQLIFTNPKFFAYSRMFYVKTLARFTQNGHRQFWQSMRNKVRDVVPTPAFGLRMIMAKEAALWIGGVSYSVLYPRLQPILLGDLSIRDFFGVGIYKNSQKQIVAQNFIDLLLTEKIQEILTEELAVYPVVKGVTRNKKLPAENFEDESRDAVRSGYIDWRSKRYLDRHKDLFEKILEGE